ncbi:MAG: hypothetical protein IT538_12310 [Variibacter sp.]|nr:hypothetical protein [Variibacter sp.]
MTDLTFSPDGSTVLSAGDNHDGFIAWYANDGKPSFTRKGYAPFSVAYSPGGQQIAVGGLDDVTLWTQFGQLKKTFYGHAKKVNNVAFTPDARQLVSASYDGTIKVWTVPPYGP